MRYSKKTRDATRLKCCACKMAMEDSKVLRRAAPATKNPTQLLKTTEKYCLCHTERLWTRCETCWNVTKCHACHAKSHAVFETSIYIIKSDHFRQKGTAIVPSSRSFSNGCERQRTVANGCGRLRTEKQRPANTSQPPDPQSKTRTLRYTFQKNTDITSTGYIFKDSNQAADDANR